MSALLSLGSLIDAFRPADGPPTQRLGPFMRWSLAGSWPMLVLAGMLSALAGVTEVAGPLGQLSDRWTPGYGFTAIIVATLGRLHAFGIVIASLFMALLYLGGEAVQITMQLPKAVSQVFQGLLLMFLLGSDVLVGYRLQFGRLGAHPRAGAPA